MNGLTIRHDDELERDYGKWVLVRRSLGVSSFGINAVELPPGESIPEHDETGRDHEELFLVLEGAPTLVVDGDTVPLAVRGSEAERRPGSAGLPTTRITCRYAGEVRPRSSVTFDDAAARERNGWREVTAGSQCGPLRGSTVPVHR